MALAALDRHPPPARAVWCIGVRAAASEVDGISVDEIADGAGADVRAVDGIVVERIMVDGISVDEISVGTPSGGMASCALLPTGKSRSAGGCPAAAPP
mmetsp:Transcript_17558/g.55460  ORF Transcript_17558/g.55460 Transcript_17558/m.55460 type:complete len:98 (-) Transcript_17558:200-493(-)